MADLKKFIWKEARSGMQIDLYLNRWPQIGQGKAEIIESLHAKLNGKGSVLGKNFSITIEVIMPDNSPSGKCTVILNDSKAEGCDYKTDGGTLIINHPKAQIKIQANDKKWTWIHVNNPVNVWIGAWPAGMDMNINDRFEDVIEHHSVM
jgi:hypothetical protein